MTIATIVIVAVIITVYLGALHQYNVLATRRQDDVLYRLTKIENQLHVYDGEAPITNPVIFPNNPHICQRTENE